MPGRVGLRYGAPPLTDSSQKSHIPSYAAGAANERLQSRRRTSHLLTAVCAYSALVIVLTFPLILHLDSRIPRDLEDSLWYVTTLWWNAHVIPFSAEWWNGFSFFPAPGAMAFSDHMLGASLIASPLQWLGFSPITAYNLTFLASFPLCAISAHVLALSLTRRHDAALLAGLAYGFNPYRVAHLEHLELLLAFGMPAALAALHQFTATRHPKWLVVLGMALLVQALSTSYYALFFAIFLCLWVAWFIQPRAWRQALAIGASAGAAALAVAPIVVAYSAIHERHSLKRDFAEVLTYSADVSSFVTASAVSALWGWTAPLNGGERQLFPGLTITLLVLIGATLARARQPAGRDRLAALSVVCWVLSACLVAVATAARLAGPWQIDSGWLRVSITVAHKPLSLALAFGIAAFALSPSVRAAARRRSAVAFYLIAAAVFFLCSLGPRPTFLGEQVLYEPPYAWLMRLPFFSDNGTDVPAIRVPARFAMLGILALAVAGSLLFARLVVPSRQRFVLAAVVAGAIVADGWIGELPLREPPGAFPIDPADPAVAVLELPPGDARSDTAAMYRATLHGRPTVNGYHSFAPLSHQILKLGLADRDPTVLDGLAVFGPLLIASDRAADRTGEWTALVSSHRRATRIAESGTWALFHLRARPSPKSQCGSRTLAVTAAFHHATPVVVASLTDGRPETYWITPRPQQAGDSLRLDLAHVDVPCGVVLSLGAQAGSYPRLLTVATSPDGRTWEHAFRSRMTGATFLAALEDARDPRVFVPLREKAARYIELRLEQSEPSHPWAVADVVVQARTDADR